jgi:hypothetical protein
MDSNNSRIEPISQQASAPYPRLAGTTGPKVRALPRLTDPLRHLKIHRRHTRGTNPSSAPWLGSDTCDPLLNQCLYHSIFSCCQSLPSPITVNVEIEQILNNGESTRASKLPSLDQLKGALESDTSGL